MAHGSPNSFDAIVVGAGLAGAFAALALRKRQLRVLVLEREPHPASRGSGNAFGLLVPYLAARPSALTTTYRGAFDYSRAALLSFADSIQTSGALQLPSTQRLLRDMHENVPIISHPAAQRVSAIEASSLSGVPLSSEAFWIEQAMYLKPPEIVSRALDCGTSCRYGAEVVSLSRTSTDTWSVGVKGEDTSLVEAPIVVVCSAYEAATLSQCQKLPLEPIRGQTVMVAATDASKRLQCPLCFDGYVVPASSDQHLVGALYRHDDLGEVPSPDDSRQIIERCHEWFSAGFTTPISERVCFRTSTFDRLPYIGALPDFARMDSDASAYQPGTDLSAKVEISRLPGLFVSLGHGSRGLQTSPWGGEIIARLATGEQLGSLSDGAHLCRPERVTGRLLRRRE